PLLSVAIVAITWPVADPTRMLKVKPGAVMVWPEESRLTTCSSPVGVGVGVGVGAAVAVGAGVGVLAGGSATEMTAVAPAVTSVQAPGVYSGATRKPAGAAVSSRQYVVAA